MDMLLGSALAVTLLPISLVFSRALVVALVVGVVGFYLRFLWAIQREASRSHSARKRKRSLTRLSSWTAKKRWLHLSLSQCSLHDVSHREDSVDVAMTDD
mgnify:CR=1 FL=1|jgi:hypothetical protein